VHEPIGGKSNSGERRLRIPPASAPLRMWMQVGTRPRCDEFGAAQRSTRSCSAIKQIASGRFGVTPALPYAVGAKLGRSRWPQGQAGRRRPAFRGPKVDAYIAGLRTASPGVALISLLQPRTTNSLFH